MTTMTSDSKSIEAMSPTARAKAFNRLREFLKGHEFERYFSIEERALFDAELKTLARHQFRTVIFRHLRTEGPHDYFEIGYQGEPLRTVKTSLRGVWPVWWALDDGGTSESLRASDLAAPDADEPEQSVRRMIHNTAAKEFERWNLPELASAAKACKVASGTGVVRCERPAHSPKVITH